MPSSGHTPARTCIGCRTVCPARELLRLAAPDGSVIVWPRKRGAGVKAGRGAWIHPRQTCVDAALKARAFGRAFRRNVEPPTSGDLLAALAAAAGQEPLIARAGEKT